MAQDVDQIAADQHAVLKSWEKPELTRIEFGEAEAGPTAGTSDAGSLS